MRLKLKLLALILLLVPLSTANAGNCQSCHQISIPNPVYVCGDPIQGQPSGIQCRDHEEGCTFYDFCIYV